MSDDVVLDTHAWVDVVTGAKLAAAAKRRIGAASEAGCLWIAAITPWEIAMLASKGRLRLGMPTLDWIAASLQRSGIQVAPLEPSIAVDAAELPGAFHGDPADRLIVATTRHLAATIATRDRAIRAYGSLGHVRVVGV